MIPEEVITEWEAVEADVHCHLRVHLGSRIHADFVSLLFTKPCEGQKSFVLQI